MNSKTHLYKSKVAIINSSSKNDFEEGQDSFICNCFIAHQIFDEISHLRFHKQIDESIEHVHAVEEKKSYEVQTNEMRALEIRLNRCRD